VVSKRLVTVSYAPLPSLPCHAQQTDAKIVAMQNPNEANVKVVELKHGLAPSSETVAELIELSHKRRGQ
jgi:hypothetical protein